MTTFPGNQVVLRKMKTVRAIVQKKCLIPSLDFYKSRIQDSNSSIQKSPTAFHGSKPAGQDSTTNTNTFVQLDSSVKTVVRSKQPRLSKEHRRGWQRTRLCLCSTHYLSVRFSHATACTAVSSTNSFLALSLLDPLYLPSKERPYTGPITAEQTHRAISMSTHVRTSSGAAQEIPELHVGSLHTED